METVRGHDYASHASGTRRLAVTTTRGGGRNRTAVRGFAGTLLGSVAVRLGTSLQVVGQVGVLASVAIRRSCGITVA